ncbi:hypothetical protein FXF51_21045 [Nonomuraea sp. PA05]|uniref:hypothetical protein n=1 Tax=Nonomuraea sp. PA05 TaxID=2604466 RepID=UPI0011DA9F7F|nr:hypothetical protein [Nonomuraea sp. PA05]TYB64229.1 hypothetical protein FXF51_21045 [Nonomuraea sp. PA05]
MRPSLKTMGTLALGGALAASLLSAPAASAATLPGCPVPRTANVDHGTGVMKGTFNLKTAPYAACGNVARLRAGQVLYFHCWTLNRYGKHWVYARVKGSKTYGWMSLDNLRSVKNSRPTFCPGEDHRSEG